MDNLVKRVHQGKGKRALVVLGAAKVRAGFGYRGWPRREFVAAARRQTRIVQLDEHLTSQRCNACSFGTNRAAALSRIVRGPSQNHHTRHCTECSCRFHVAVGRDYNASANLFKLFHWILEHGKRHYAFWHPSARNYPEQIISANAII